jgi:hypothetical protein
MRNRSFLIAAGISLLLSAGPAFAGGNSDSPAPFNISNAQDFAQQAAAVRSGLQPGGEYAGLSARNRYLVTRNLDFMAALMQQRGGIESMTGSERVRLYNAQSQTNRLLTGNASDAVTCAYEPQTGSHLRSTQCWSSDRI